MGTVNDPQKSFHAEFTLRDPVRAEKLDAMLAELGIPARRITRSSKIGLYYKKESDLEDLFAGAFAPLVDESCGLSEDRLKESDLFFSDFKLS